MDRDRHGDEHPHTGRRRTVDVSAGATLALGLPWFLCSLGTIAAGTAALGPVMATVIILGWVTSGLVMLSRPMADVLATVFFRLQRPTDAEDEHLRSLWDPIAAAAGVDGTRYTLRIQESDQVNAYAAAGHIVAVTRWSLQMLAPSELAAVLAHELGHHLGGHAWSTLLSYWYSLPARAVLRCARIVTRFMLVVLAYTSLLGFVVAAGSLALAALVMVHSYPALLVVVLMPPLLAYFGRLSELRCDRLAAELGYGDALIEVILQWEAEGHDFQRSALLATHPTCAKRVRALDDFLAQQ